MINSLESILDLITWLEKNNFKVVIGKHETAALELYGKTTLGAEQVIQIGERGWVTRKTNYVNATIFAGEVLVIQGDISDKTK